LDAGARRVGQALDIVTCVSFPRDRPSPEHDLVRAFRAGDPEAFERVVGMAGIALARHGARLLGPGTIAVTVPGHRAGSRNAACESLVARLATEWPELLSAPGVLSRLRDAPEAKAAPGRDLQLEVETLRWSPDLVPAGARRVLLVDDVVATGATLEAAICALPALLALNAAVLAIFRAV